MNDVSIFIGEETLIGIELARNAVNVVESGGDMAVVEDTAARMLAYQQGARYDLYNTIDNFNASFDGGDKISVDAATADFSFDD